MESFNNFLRANSRVVSAPTLNLIKGTLNQKALDAFNAAGIQFTSTRLSKALIQALRSKEGAPYLRQLKDQAQALNITIIE